MKPVPANPWVAPKYLFDMPANILRGKTKRIEAWCAERNLCRPTLLHLDLARRARGVNR